jgi:hypothetical protein
MDRQRDSLFEPRGKLVRIVRQGRRPATTTDVALVQHERAQRRKDERAAAWLRGTWVVMAWVVSICRLRLGVARHEVFGVESTMAFVVAISLPLLHGRKVVAAVRSALKAFRRARAARRSARTQQESFPPSASNDGRSLQ